MARCASICVSRGSMCMNDQGHTAPCPSPQAAMLQKLIVLRAHQPILPSWHHLETRSLGNSEALPWPSRSGVHIKRLALWNRLWGSLCPSLPFFPSLRVCMYTACSCAWVYMYTQVCMHVEARSHPQMSFLRNYISLEKSSGAC